MKRTLHFLIFLLLILGGVVSNAQVSAGWKYSVKNTLNSINKAVALEANEKGFCYVLAMTWAPDSLKEMLILKYTPEGKEEWRRTYRHPDPGDNIPVAMALDTSGNVWIAGTLRPKGKESDADILIVKFTVEGVPDVSVRYKGPAELFDTPSAITTDVNGNAYIGGYITSADSGLNALVLKYDILGTLKWSRTFASLQMDVIRDLAADDSSNVYVTGIARADMRSSDILVMKYDAEGERKWQTIYDGVYAENDAGAEIILDDSANVYVTGVLNLMNGRSDIPILKFNRDGQLLQENIIAGKINENIPAGLMVTKTNIYIASSFINYSMETNGSSVFKFNKAGEMNFKMENPADVTFSMFAPVDGNDIVFGRKLARPENTWQPYISFPDSTGQPYWEYQDSSVTGIADMVSVRVSGNRVFYLGDDTGDATGTIYIMKYDILNEQKKQ